MFFYGLRALPVFALLLAGALVCEPAVADETGLASIHQFRKVGKKTCLVDHSHDGAGTGTSRQVAELSAIRSWMSFTDLEYGSDWAQFRMAISKSMRCSTNGPGNWSCQLEAVPCRGW
jgi:hypothetical protein